MTNFAYCHQQMPTKKICLKKLCDKCVFTKKVGAIILLIRGE